MNRDTCWFLLVTGRRKSSGKNTKHETNRSNWNKHRMRNCARRLRKWIMHVSATNYWRSKIVCVCLHTDSLQPRMNYLITSVEWDPPTVARWQLTNCRIQQQQINFLTRATAVAEWNGVSWNVNRQLTVKLSLQKQAWKSVQLAINHVNVNCTLKEKCSTFMNCQRVNPKQSAKLDEEKSSLS